MFFFNQLSIINNYQGNIFIRFSAKFIHIFFSFMFKKHKGIVHLKVYSLNAIDPFFMRRLIIYLWLCDFDIQ